MRPFVLAFLCLAPIAARGEDPLDLQSALKRAFESRASIRAARLRVTEAEASRRALGSNFPTRILAGYSTSDAVGGSDQDAMIAQPLDLFGRSSAGRAVGDALVLQAKANLRSTFLNVQTEVVGLYNDAAAASELADTARKTLEVAEQLEHAIKRRVAEGVVPGVQATRVSIEVERARANARRREAELAAGLTRLAASIGSTRDLLVVGPLQLVATSETATLEHLRPDLLLLSASVHAAEAEARLIRTSGMPELEIQARRSPWQDRQGEYGARIQLSFPLWDSKSKNEVLAASNRAKAAGEEYADALAIANSEVAAAQQEAEADEAEVASFGKIVESARLLVDRTRTGLTEGASTLIEVLDAIRALRETEEGLIEARLRLARAQARLLRAKGELVVTP